jgi:hypothetical protein
MHRQREPRDLGLPKRPQSSYFLWANAVRPEIQRQNPGASITEMARILGEEWKFVTDDDKHYWDRRAAEMRKQYNTDMDSYRNVVLLRATLKGLIVEAKSLYQSLSQIDTELNKHYHQYRQQLTDIISIEPDTFGYRDEERIIETIDTIQDFINKLGSDFLELKTGIPGYVSSSIVF